MLSVIVLCSYKLQSDVHQNIDIFYVWDIDWLFIHFVLPSDIAIVARLPVKLVCCVELGNLHLFIKSGRISSHLAIYLCNGLRRIESVNLFSFAAIILLQGEVFMIKLSYVLLAVSRTNIFNNFVLSVQNDISQFTEVFDYILNFKMAIDIDISMRRLFLNESEI